MRWPVTLFVRWAFVNALVACALVVAPALAGPVAVIASVKGRVSVTSPRARGVVPAVFGRPLEQGDKVTVGAGGKATLFFDDGNIIEMSERGSITIGGRLATGVRGATLPGEVYARVSRLATSGSRQTGLVAMGQMRADSDEGFPLLLAPRHTSILTGAPALAWRAVAGAARYRVRMSAEGRELWTRDVPAEAGMADLLVPYPDGVAQLAPGAEAQWEVEALDERGALRRESTTVRVLPAAARVEAETNLARISAGAGGSSSSAARFLAGSYLSSLGLHQDAAEQFRALALLAPESADPHEALGSAYLEMGLTDLAASEFQRALALQRVSR